ncbi:hypothetical protein [Pontibacter silvestris]|uniref:hypothetical protein n=1 Tax=Pontibacter silvestris TaxID=2305183 RepID=UPI00366A6ACB
MVHLSSAETTVSHDPELQILHLTSRGNISSSLYRLGLTTALQVTQKENLHYWITDNLEAAYISPTDQDWFNEVIAPALANSTDLKKMALIEPKDVYNRMILEEMIEMFMHTFPFPMQFFNDVPSAIEWFHDSNSLLLL